jgi:hypothetical protein
MDYQRKKASVGRPRNDSPEAVEARVEARLVEMKLKMDGFAVAVFQCFDKLKDYQKKIQYLEERIKNLERGDPVRKKKRATDTLLDDLEPGMQVTYTVTNEKAIYQGAQWSGSVRIQIVSTGEVKQTKAHYLTVGWDPC